MHVQGSALSWVQDSLNLAYVEVNDVVLKRLSSKASNGISPQVIPGYAREVCELYVLLCRRIKGRIRLATVVPTSRCLLFGHCSRK